MVGGASSISLFWGQKELDGIGLVPLRYRCEADSIGGTARENTRQKAGQKPLSLWNPASYSLSAGVTDKEPRGLGQIIKLWKVKFLDMMCNSVVEHMSSTFNTQKRR